MVITDFLERNARLYGDETALVEINPSEERDRAVSWSEANLIDFQQKDSPYRRAMSWQDFDRRADRVANMLLSRDLPKGTKVGILLLNCLEWLPIYFGILKAGMIAVPLNFRYSAEEIRQKYAVECICLDCLNMGEGDILRVLSAVLDDFPIDSVGFFLPDWLDALPESNQLKNTVYADIAACFSGIEKQRDVGKAVAAISEKAEISSAEQSGSEPGEGRSMVTLCLPRSLYYQSISEETGVEIRNDGDLFSALSELSSEKSEYERLKDALESVRERGYGVVLPEMSQLQLEEPKIVRQGGRYSVRLKAKAPAIHMMMTNIETEVTPAIAGETASEDIIGFLLQGFDGDMNRIWESNIFGKSLYDIACESLTNKICSLSDNARSKLQHTLERIINEGSTGLICILL